MEDYEVKKVIQIDNNISLAESEKILDSDDVCLGLLDESREISSFVIRKDLLSALKFGIKNMPISLIATKADFLKQDEINSAKADVFNFTPSSLNKGVFAGTDKKNTDRLFIARYDCTNKSTENMKDIFEAALCEKTRTALAYCSKAADKISLPVYIIGGIVRDLITGKKSLDIDLTVEENAIEFSRFLEKEYRNICRIVSIHDDFKTAKVAFNINGEQIIFDIASTRKESYKKPAELPVIEEIGCNICEDVSRRDFTINSMAISLNEKLFCDLIDPLKAYNDLQKGIIRVIHPLSFVDDPTRIIRALKFSVRFGFELESATKSLQESCLRSGLFTGLCGERVKSEIKQTFNLNKKECFDKFVDKKIFLLVSENILNGKKLVCGQQIETAVSKYFKYIENPDFIWLIYLGSLLINITENETAEILLKLNLSGIETRILNQVRDIVAKTDLIEKTQTRFEVYELLENYSATSIITALINMKNEKAASKLDLYLKELKDIKIHTTGKDLVEAGFLPGPVFGDILHELLKARINGEILSQENEKEFIERYKKA
jgi:tRNA nucleotidyltransferase (CCA-adding enzyme)